MNFSKYLPLTIFVLSLTANVNTKCMEKSAKIPNDCIDFNNPKELQKAMLSNANHMVNSHDDSKICAAFNILDIAIDKSWEFDNKAVEKSCESAYKNGANNVKLAVLKVLNNLVYRDQATQTALEIAGQAILLDNPEIQKEADDILHNIIVLNNKVQYISDATLQNIMVTLYAVHQDDLFAGHQDASGDKHAKERRSVFKNIIITLSNKATEAAKNIHTPEVVSDESSDNV